MTRDRAGMAQPDFVVTQRSSLPTHTLSRYAVEHPYAGINAALRWIR